MRWPFRKAPELKRSLVWATADADYFTVNLANDFLILSISCCFCIFILTETCPCQVPLFVGAADEPTRFMHWHIGHRDSWPVHVHVFKQCELQ